MEVDAMTVDDKDSAASDKNETKTTEKDIIDHIVQENKAFFRSQQINDPDITESEKIDIVNKILQESHKKFLFRFGSFIKAEHLAFFEGRDYPPADDYEIKYFLKDLKKKLNNRQRDIKNRRYAALQKMIEDNNYFSEKEMMSRQPLLYENLVGQYMTDTEKKIRDNFDPNTEFSNVLLEGISKNHIEELRKKQQSEEGQSDTTEDSSQDTDEEAHNDGIIDDNLYPQTPPSFKEHWGSFDEDSAAGSSNNKNTDTTRRHHSAKQNYITAAEKNLLRDEFIGIMHSNFLSGKDEDFDYTTVDDNTDYDNLALQSQDEEDKYFGTDDDEITEINRDVVNESSEDELDAYMKQINENQK